MLSNSSMIKICRRAGAPRLHGLAHYPPLSVLAVFVSVHCFLSLCFFVSVRCSHCFSVFVVLWQFVCRCVFLCGGTDGLVLSGFWQWLVGVLLNRHQSLLSQLRNRGMDTVACAMLHAIHWWWLSMYQDIHAYDWLKLMDLVAGFVCSSS